MIDLSMHLYMHLHTYCHVSSYITHISYHHFISLMNGRNGLSQGLHFGGVACCVFNLWKCYGLRVEFVAECEQLEHDWNSLELEDDFNEWNNQSMLFYAFPHHAFEVTHVHVTPAMFETSQERPARYVH